MRYAVAFAILLSLTGCDSDNVHWKAVSNPSGTPPHPQGGTVIVVVHSSTLAPDRSKGPVSHVQWAQGQRVPADRSVEVYLLSSLEGIVSDAEAVHSESIRIIDPQGEEIVEIHDRHLLRLEPAR